MLNPVPPGPGSELSWVSQTAQMGCHTVPTFSDFISKHKAMYCYQCLPCCGAYSNLPRSAVPWQGRGRGWPRADLCQWERCRCCSWQNPSDWGEGKYERNIRWNLELIVKLNNEEYCLLYFCHGTGVSAKKRLAMASDSHSVTEWSRCWDWSIPFPGKFLSAFLASGRTQLIQQTETKHGDKPVSLRDEEHFQQTEQRRWCGEALSPADLSVNSIIAQEEQMENGYKFCVHV